MEFNEEPGNPWLKITENIILNLDLSNRKACSLPTAFENTFLGKCKLCNIIFLKHTFQNHFKIHHGKGQPNLNKLSKYKYPFDALEACDALKEYRIGKISIKKKQKETNIHALIDKESDQLKFNKNEVKPIVKPEPKLKKPNLKGKPDCKLSKRIKSTRTVSEKKENCENVEMESVTTKFVDNRIDLNTNITDNSNKITSVEENINNTVELETGCRNKIKSEIPYVLESGMLMGNSTSRLKSIGIDETNGCTIFTDEFNNSIIIDNDRDESEDLDCYESSVSNDSAYYSLPNNNNNIAAKDNNKKMKLHGSVDSLVKSQYHNGNTIHKDLVNTSNKMLTRSNLCRQNYTKKTSNITNLANITKSHDIDLNDKISNTNNNSNNSNTTKSSNIRHRFYISGHRNENVLKCIFQNPIGNNSNGEFGATKPTTNNYQHSRSNDVNSKYFTKKNVSNIEMLNYKNFVNSVIESTTKEFLSSENKSLEYNNQKMRSQYKTSSNGSSTRLIHKNHGSRIFNSYYPCVTVKNRFGPILIPKSLLWKNSIQNRPRPQYNNGVINKGKLVNINRPPISNVHYNTNNSSSSNINKDINFQQFSQLRSKSVNCQEKTINIISHPLVLDNPLLSSYTLNIGNVEPLQKCNKSTNEISEIKCQLQNQKLLTSSTLVVSTSSSSSSSLSYTSLTNQQQKQQYQTQFSQKPQIRMAQNVRNQLQHTSNTNPYPQLCNNIIPNTFHSQYQQPTHVSHYEHQLRHNLQDQNQMSFQQRLLERGVISRRDIARSQRFVTNATTNYAAVTNMKNNNNNVSNTNNNSSSNSNIGNGNCNEFITDHKMYKSIPKQSKNINNSTPTVSCHSFSLASSGKNAIYNVSRNGTSIKNENSVIYSNTTSLSNPIYFNTGYINKMPSNLSQNSCVTINEPVSSLSTNDNQIRNIWNTSQIYPKTNQVTGKTVNNYCQKFGLSSIPLRQNSLDRKIPIFHHSITKANPIYNDSIISSSFHSFNDNSL